MIHPKLARGCQVHSTPNSIESDDELMEYARSLRLLFGGPKFAIGSKSPHFALITVDRAGWDPTVAGEAQTPLLRLIPSPESIISADQIPREPAEIQEESIQSKLRVHEGMNYIWMRSPSDHRNRINHPEAAVLRFVPSLLEVIFGTLSH